MKILIALIVSALTLPVFAQETVIKGKRMELINKGESVVFSGGVHLERGADEITSDEMQTTKTRDKVTAKGDVKLLRQLGSTETWKGFGDQGFYDTQSGEGYLMGTKKKQAHVIHSEVLSSTATRVVDITADRIDFHKEQKDATAAGAVKGKTVDPQSGDLYEFWSSNAYFDGNKKELTLTGTPPSVVKDTAEKEKKTITGDKIVYNVDDKSFISEGHAVAVFENEEEEKGAQSK